MKNRGSRSPLSKIRCAVSLDRGVDRGATSFDSAHFTAMGEPQSARLQAASDCSDFGYGSSMNRSRTERATSRHFLRHSERDEAERET